jgi:hypothetical protein
MLNLISSQLSEVNWKSKSNFQLDLWIQLEIKINRMIESTYMST